MSNNDFLARALNSLQETVNQELRDDLRSARKREYATCAGRVLARMHADVSAVPLLAAQRLDQWRELNEAAGGPSGSDPRAELYAQAALVSAKLRAAGEGSKTTNSTWFRKAVSITRDYLDAYEKAVPANASQPSGDASPRESQCDRLASYLRARFPALPPNPVLSLRIVPGGRAKETSVFELVPNDVLPTRLVLRRDLALSVTGTSSYAEFPLLKAAQALGIPVPTPILAEKNPSHLGGSFIIMTEVTGAKVGGELFAELNDLSGLDSSFAAALVTALAQLHTLTSHPSGDQSAEHSNGSDPGEMVRGFQKMFDDISSKPPMHVATELGFAWLLANPLPKGRPVRLVHGDLGLHNVLVRDGRLAAILDWELAHLGDPAEDIGYVWSALLRQLLPWKSFEHIYSSAGGMSAAYDAHAVSWYSVWAHTRNSVYVAMHYAWAADGRRSDIECFNAGMDFFARTQCYIARELDDALSRKM